VGAQVYGISSDSPAANKAFAESQQLPFPLLTDPAGALRKVCRTLLMSVSNETNIWSAKGQLGSAVTSCVMRVVSASSVIAADLRPDKGGSRKGAEQWV
jgi:peroxiredoxin